MPPTASASVSLRSESPVGRYAAVWRAVLVAYWMMLFVGTHLPATSPVVAPVIGFDKPVHFAAFFVLATLLFQAARTGGKIGWQTRLALAGVAIAYAAADELTQPFVNRTCDLYDWFADAAGVALAVLVDRSREDRG